MPRTNTPRLIKRAAIIGRLFYHTAQCLLAQTHPMEPTRCSPSMRAVQLHHAHQVCGIVAHNKDHGVSSVAIRSLAIASSVLSDRGEQDEVLGILRRITRASGWRLGGVEGELRRAWGRDGESVGSDGGAGGGGGGGGGGKDGGKGLERPFEGKGTVRPVEARAGTPGPVVAERVVTSAPVKAAVNPLSLGDFSLPNHPYQNWYEPPSRGTTFSQPFF